MKVIKYDIFSNLEILNNISKLPEDKFQIWLKHSRREAIYLNKDLDQNLLELFNKFNMFRIKRNNIKTLVLSIEKLEISEEKFLSLKEIENIYCEVIKE